MNGRFGLTTFVTQSRIVDTHTVLKYLLSLQCSALTPVQQSITNDEIILDNLSAFQAALTITNTFYFI